MNQLEELLEIIPQIVSSICYSAILEVRDVLRWNPFNPPSVLSYTGFIRIMNERITDNPDKSADMIGFDRIMLMLAELIIPAGIINFV